MVVEDSAGVTIVAIEGEVASLPAWTVEATPSYGIDGNSAPFLTRIEEVEFAPDGGLFVWERQARELYWFGPDGALKRLVGSEGEGPGEFMIVSEVTTLGDTLLVYDRQLRRLSAFDLEGRLLGTTPIAHVEGGIGSRSLDLLIVGGGRLVAHQSSAYDTANHSPRPRRDQRSSILHGMDREGLVSGESVAFAGGYTVDLESGDGRAPFSNRPTVRPVSGGVAYSSGIEYEIVVTDRDLAPTRIIRWAGQRSLLTEEDIAAARDTIAEELEPFRAQRPDLVEQLIEGTFSPNIQPELVPGMGEFLVDDLGRFWVSRFSPTTTPWDQEELWHILSEEGVPEARVILPPRSRLAAVGRDRVALIHIDEQDVQHISVRRLLEVPEGAG